MPTLNDDLSEAALALHSLSQAPSLPALNKRLRWGTATVYEFELTLGESGVPSREGPPIGLDYDSNAAQVFYSTVDEQETSGKKHRPRRFSRKERYELLKLKGVDAERILKYTRESNMIRKSRKLSIKELRVGRRADEEEKPQAPAMPKKRSWNPWSDAPTDQFVKRPRMVPADTN